jgi:hypothetical protein
VIEEQLLNQSRLLCEASPRAVDGAMMRQNQRELTPHDGRELMLWATVEAANAPATRTNEYFILMIEGRGW